MSQKQRTVEFLSNNYSLFTSFTPEMFERIGVALRIFEIKAGEQISLRSSGGNDSIFVTRGNAILSNNNINIECAAPKRNAQPITFTDTIDIITDTEATICHIDGNLMDDYRLLKNISDSSGNDMAFMGRLMFLKSTQAFRLLPVDTVEEAAKRCEEIQVNTDDVIIQQDSKADGFFILLEGEAEVWREELEDDEPQMVASLEKGATFGEEALIIGGARNATIKMTTDGKLLKLSKDDFDDLISSKTIKSVTAEVAQVMVSGGAEIIDVRYEDEYEINFIKDSLFIPLPVLRDHIAKLDKDKEYLILCAGGYRAAAAALLLRQQHINATFIIGGIKAWPPEDVQQGI